MSLTLFNIDFGQWNFPLFRRKPKTILICDDDETTAHLIRATAESYGLTVKAAATAEEALGILDANGKRFVMVLVDVNLPGMSGWTFRGILHDRWPALKVVVMSASEASFHDLPKGELLRVLVKSSQYGPLFQGL